MKRVPDSARRRGVAYILAVILLALFAAMAVALASETSLNVRVSENHVHGQAAQFDAESGLAYLARMLKGVTGIPSSATAQQVVDLMAQQLPALIGATNLNNQCVVHTPGQPIIDIPFIALDDRGGGFSARIDISNGKIRCRVTGSEPVVRFENTPCSSTRNVRMAFAVSAGQAAGFNYGIQSRGRIALTGNARVRGADNDRTNAAILSGTYSTTDAVNLNGNCTIDGDVSVSSPAGQVSMTGNISIGGETLSGGHIQDHIHVGIGEQEFPEADPTVFEPFATNIVDHSTNTNGNRTFTNIRILANTNPTFSGNITIRGVVFVETPNVVRFSGNLDLTGVVVTQDAGDGNLAGNAVNFSGNTTIRGVESLPSGPEFAGLQALPGTFLLAPGFSVSFTGNFGSINGAMAADEFKWAGNAGGDVYGSIINWADTEFRMVGNSNLTIHRDHSSVAPPGFVKPSRLLPDPATYEEPAPGQ